MITHPVQFSIVREDPALELSLLDEGDREVVVVASAGCTALTLAAARPELRLTLFDINPAQLDLVEQKADALRRHAHDRPALLSAFGVDDPSPETLSGRGNFEALFRALGHLLDELVIARSDRRQAFIDAAAGGPLGCADEVRAHRFWPVAFDLCFSDALLHEMFGPAATQHAAGSYARYFQGVVERGMLRSDAGTNPWLAHVLLGCFVPTALPPLLQDPRPPNEGQLQRLEGGLDAVPDAQLASADMVQLSNIFDWTAADEVERHLLRLGESMKPGARLVLRQLNAAMDLLPWMAARFDLDAAADDARLADDRSLFYDRIIVGTAKPR